MEATITAEEIKEIRGQYGLTQKSFAQILGIGAASIVRYEQGDTPSKANANLIRAARHPEFVLECLEREGALIPERQRENATKVIYALISLDEEEGSTFMKNKLPDRNNLTEMDIVYHYTLQQEILNEQAANLVCDIINYMIKNNIDCSDDEHPVSIMLAQLLMLKRDITGPESCDDVFLERIRGHLMYLTRYVEELTKIAEVA